MYPSAMSSMISMAISAHRQPFLIVIIIISALPFITGDEHERRLYKFLFSNYSVYERPVLNHSDSVNVNFQIVLTQLVDVDEKNQTMQLNVWYKYEWTDQNLIWIPADYGGVDHLSIPYGSLWKPDILLYNNVGSDFDTNYPVNYLLYSDGMVNWLPPAIVRSSCIMDVTWFPFDEQRCVLKFGSWSYGIRKLNLTSSDPPWDLSEYRRNGEWNIISADRLCQRCTVDMCGLSKNGLHSPCSSAVSFLAQRWLDATLLTCSDTIGSLRLKIDTYKFKFLLDIIDFSEPESGVIRNQKSYDCCHGNYIDLKFVLYLRRRTLYYGFNKIVPSLLIALTALLSFSLPVESIEKITLEITIFLSMYLFLDTLASVTPPTSDSLPFLGIFYSSIMILVSASVVFNIMTLNLHYRTPYKCVMSPIMRKILLRWLPPLVFMRPRNRSIKRARAYRRNVRTRTQTSNGIEQSSSGRCHRDKGRTTKQVPMVYVDQHESDHVTEGVLPLELERVYREVRLISRELKRKEVIFVRAESDWRYASRVVDRACLIILFSLVAAASCVVAVFAHKMKG